MEYMYHAILYGLVNTPSVFQAIMNTTFHDMLNRFVIVDIDDILVYSKILMELPYKAGPLSVC